MFLNGSELAGYIKARQAQAAQHLKQTLGVRPKLVILQAKDDPAINTYVRLKQHYGEDVGVIVDIKPSAQHTLLDKVKQFNRDKAVHGIIIQLPLPDPAGLDEILNAVAPAKDVDGLGKKSKFDSASATAILWLLAGYNIDLVGKQIVVVGQGRLIGQPLTTMLEQAGHSVTPCDSTTNDLADRVRAADIVISATGSPRLIKADWLKAGAVVVDAGTASEAGELVGDLDDAVYGRDDLKLTPKKGGVGPLTVSALFDNLLRAAQQSAGAHTKKQ